MQCTAAGTDEHELGVNLARLTGTTIADLDDPAAIGLLGEVGDLVAEEHGAAGRSNVVDELFGERTEVDVGAGLGPVQRDRVGEVAAFGMSGRCSENHSGLSEYSMPAKSGCPARAS